MTKSPHILSAEQQTLIAQLESSLLRAWPAVETQIAQGWAIRFAHGYSGRANSASAIQSGAVLNEKLLAYVNAFYRGKNQPSIFRVSPLCSDTVAEQLKQRGFKSRGLAHTMIASLEIVPETDNPGVALSPHASDQWLNLTTSHQTEATKRNPEGLRAIVSRITLPVAFATCTANDQSVGFGVAAIDKGWAEIGSVVIDKAYRDKGHGRALVTSLLAWAKQQHATHAFLQVDVNNAPAISLYRSLGFSVLYDYDTLQRSTEA